MCKIIKKSFLTLLANAANKAAFIDCGSASLLGYHQPKEPDCLKNRKQ